MDEPINPLVLDLASDGSLPCFRPLTRSVNVVTRVDLIQVRDFGWIQFGSSLLK